MQLPPPTHIAHAASPSTSPPPELEQLAALILFALLRTQQLRLSLLSRLLHLARLLFRPLLQPLLNAVMSAPPSASSSSASVASSSSSTSSSSSAVRLRSPPRTVPPISREELAEVIADLTELYNMQQPACNNVDLVTSAIRTILRVKRSPQGTTWARSGRRRIVYVRVSHLLSGGVNLANQIEDVCIFLELTYGVPDPTWWFVEDGETPSTGGKPMDTMHELIKAIKLHQFDGWTLVVYSLSRLGRRFHANCASVPPPPRWLGLDRIITLLKLHRIQDVVQWLLLDGGGLQQVHSSVVLGLVRIAYTTRL